MSRAAQPQTIGISAIAVHDPPWVLENSWFNGSLSRKFVNHTGTQTRRISSEDEVTMAVRVLERLQRETSCALQDCAAVLLVVPSAVPASVTRRFCVRPSTPEVPLQRMAKQLADRLGLSRKSVLGINWFCSGYTKAFAFVHRNLLPRLTLRQDQFMLVVTVSRISRITDYACPTTGPLFGDMATVTVLSLIESQKYPVHFSLLIADAQMRPADKVFFDFCVREKVLVPTPDGGSAFDQQRLVFSLDGLGIADVAPRVMADATSAALRAALIRPEDVRFVVPHQAGVGIVRLATMKLEEIGVRGEIINGLTGDVGNVSSCSIPFALKKTWATLDGTIACPSAGVGLPAEARVSQGCVLLHATRYHKQSCGS